MGMTITIGNAVLSYETEIECVSVTINVAYAEGAPVTSSGIEFKTNINVWSGGYRELEDLAEKAGIADYLDIGQNGAESPAFRDEGLLFNHPDVTKITQADVDFLSDKLAAMTFSKEGISSKADQAFNFLNFLYYWCDWAVKNCEHPAVMNG